MVIYREDLKTVNCGDEYFLCFDCRFHIGGMLKQRMMKILVKSDFVSKKKLD